MLKIVQLSLLKSKKQMHSVPNGRCLFIIILLLLLVACQNSEQVPVVNEQITPPSQPTDTPATNTPPPATPTSQPTIQPTEPPQNTPTPMPVIIQIGVGDGVPVTLSNSLRENVATQPELAWNESESDTTLTLNGAIPLAEWVYAVAAPFPTIPDNISLTAVQTAWQTGDLILDNETNAVLSALWGEPDQPATIVAVDELPTAVWQAQIDYTDLSLTILPFDQLTPRFKVLRVDGLSPLDSDFDSANYPLTMRYGFDGDETTAVALQANWTAPTTNRDPAKMTRIAMTGPAGMRRAVADRMEKYGYLYPVEETGPVLQAADIAHISNEDPFASDCPMPDPTNSDNVCNRDPYIEVYAWVGADVMEMTGNHLNDWRADSFSHTMDLYQQQGFQTFGGGLNLEHAQEPLKIEHNGNKLAFVGCNPVGPVYDWATETRAGTMPCDDYSVIVNNISQLRDEGYLVIATQQYLEYYQYDVWDQQRADFRQLADAGATIVSGSQGHHPQGFDLYGDSFIHYGTGNLLADQMWSLGTRQMFIDQYIIYDGRLIGTDLWTGLNEDYARVRKMTPEERQDLLQAVFDASSW